MKYGYARVSSLDQNLDRQIKALQEEGCTEIFTDKITGTTTERPKLQELFSVLKEGDTILVTDLTRFTRSSMDLFNLIQIIKEKKAFLKSIKDTWLDISEDNPYSKFLITVMAGVNQLERDLIQMRQKEGIAIAKEKGIYRGRPKTFTENNPRLKHALDLYEGGGYSVKEVCGVTGISPATFYRQLKRRRENEN